MNSILKDAFYYAELHENEIINLWEELVNIDSGSFYKKGVDSIALLIDLLFKNDGAKSKIIFNSRSGNVVSAVFGPDRLGEPILSIGHYDTVFKEGTAKERPFTIKAGKAYGPGVLDMKGGLVVAYFAIKALECSDFKSRPIKIESAEKPHKTYHLTYTFTLGP